MFSDRLQEIFGMVTKEELDLLRTVAGSCAEDPYLLDIGTGPGTMLLAFLEERPRTHAISIDILESSAPGYLNDASLRDVDVTFLRGDSTALGAKLFAEDTQMDVIILDGDATPNKVTEDLHALCPCLVEGGLLLVHDYGVEYPMWAAKKAAVDKYARYNGLTFSAVQGSLAVFSKGSKKRKAKNV